MGRFLRILLLVAVPLLIAAPITADDFGYHEEVWAWVANVMPLPGTNKIIVSFGLEPNEHQVCGCRIVGVRIQCMCDKPRLGVCLETGERRTPR